MPWVQRDVSNTICGVFANQQSGFADEFLSDTDPAVMAFFAPKAAMDPLEAWDIITFKICFNHENRIRALEGKPAITVAQFKTAIRNMVNP